MHILHLIQTVADSVYNSIPSPKIITSIPFIGSLVASAILGTIKKFIVAKDSVVLNAIKPFQPIIVTAGGILLPILAKLIGFDAPSFAQALAVAPLGALTALIIREFNQIVTKKS